MMLRRLWQALDRSQQKSASRPVAMRTVHVMISGRVQGVGYRAWTKRQADIRGLSGWVCNRETGSVEAVFSGDVGAVAAMLDAVRDGPAGALVYTVEVADYAGPSGVAGSSEFLVKPTY
jgi:acylphosphatase